MKPKSKHDTNIKKIATHGDQSPGYVRGNYIINQTIVKQYKETNIKKWRQLAEHNYPADELNHYWLSRYLSQQVLHLNRTFKGSGYNDFVGVLRFTKVESEGDKIPVICLISHESRFIGAIRSSFIILHSTTVDIQSRKTYQDELNAELSDLIATWAVNVNIRPDTIADEDLIPLHFIYDPDDRRISVSVPDVVSTEPTDYPDKLRTTSELLTFLACILKSNVSTLDMGYVHSYYPLTKLIIEFIDNRSFRWDKIRINVKDNENWDYIDTKYDAEVRRYSKKNQ